MEKQNSANGEDGRDFSKTNCKVKLMCSYGGKIQQRPHDHELAYVGGDTKILAVDRGVKFADIVSKLITLCNVLDFSLKYQLPGEGLDALVSLIDDEDLEHMMAEYDRTVAGPSKPARLRLFLFTPNHQTKTGLLQSPSPPLNPDFLFGFDKEYEYEYETDSTPKPQIPWDSGADIPGTYPRNQGVAYSREDHVTNYMGAAAVYRIPVMASGHQGGAGRYGMQNVSVVPPGMAYREQPVYSFVSAMPSADCRLVNGERLEERAHQR